MTELEAIAELKEKYRTMSMCIDKEDCIKHNQALSMAINALEEIQKYRALDEMAEKLAEYEDLMEQGRMLIVPEIPKNKTLYWIWAGEIMPVLYKRITGCMIGDDGKPHIMCEMVTKKDRTFVLTYRKKPKEYTVKENDKRYFYAEDIGKTIFFTRAKANEALKMKGE